MKNVIYWSVIFVIVAAVGFYYTFTYSEEDKHCLKHSGGKSYVEAENYAYTPQGCRVVRLTSYTELCLPYHTVYVTECEGRNVVTDPQKKVEKMNSRFDDETTP